MHFSTHFSFCLWQVMKAARLQKNRGGEQGCQLCLLKRFLWSQQFLLARRGLLWQKFFNVRPQNKTEMYEWPFFFLWCCFAVTRTTSFLFIWDCRFQWAGMWWAYLMFCTLSGNVPAPKTEQSSGTHLKCNPDTQLQNTFFFCPLLSLFLFLRWSSYWKQLGVEVWVLKIWGKYQEDETKLRAGQKMKRVKQNLTIKLGERKQQH